MTVYKRKLKEGQVWYFDFWRGDDRHHGRCIHPDGTPASSKSEAKAIEQGHMVALRNRPDARVGTPTGYAFAQACATYLGTMAGKSSERDVRRHIQELLQTEWFPPHKLVTRISDMDILDYTAWSKRKTARVYVAGPIARKAAEGRRAEQESARLAMGANGGPPLEEPELQEIERDSGEQRSDATTNRYLSTLRAVLNLAHDMRDPVTGKRLLPDPPNIRLLSEAEHDPRPVPDAVIEAIIPHAEPHLIRAIWLMRATGMRLDEALTARASRCDFHGRAYLLPAEFTKGNRDEPMPLTDAALETLRILVDEARAAGHDHLILYTPPAPKDCPPDQAPAPRPVKSLRTAWEGAQRRAGITDPYRIHDLRAGFITAVAMVASEPVTRSLARHVSAATTSRYIKVVDQYRRAAVEAAAMPRIAVGGQASPNQKSQPARSGPGLKVVK